MKGQCPWPLDERDIENWQTVQESNPLRRVLEAHMQPLQLRSTELGAVDGSRTRIIQIEGLASYQLDDDGIELVLTFGLEPNPQRYEGCIPPCNTSRAMNLGSLVGIEPTSSATAVRSISPGIYATTTIDLWGGRRDSNPQRQESQSWTLPLSYFHH